MTRDVSADNEASTSPDETHPATTSTVLGTGSFEEPPISGNPHATLADATSSTSVSSGVSSPQSSSHDGTSDDADNTKKNLGLTRGGTISHGHSYDSIHGYGSRFGGLTAEVEESVGFSVERHLGDYTSDYPISAQQLSVLSQERTRQALADVLEAGIRKHFIQQTQPHKQPDDAEEHPEKQSMDLEQGGDDANGMEASVRRLENGVLKLVQRMRKTEHEEQLVDDHHEQIVSGVLRHQEVQEADKNADMAANVLTTILLRSSPESGIDPREIDHRREFFGTNAIADKKLESFCKLCWDAVQDFVLIMLIVLGIISIVVETTTLEHGETCTTCWIEGAAILCSVGIVVLVTASIDYAKQFAFIRLTKSLQETNTKAVIREGMQVAVTDDDIVVGDILSVNSHNLATIPADCILLGPASDLKMDESTLTGESKAISKKPGDVILSGTNAVQGSGKMVVIAVGINSVAGKIRARVYESEDHDGGELDGEEENSPLFVKLDLIAKRIGLAGTAAASIAFIGSLIIGLGIHKDDPREIVQYLITAITVLAVAVPEGLPLAVTLALAFSSSKMMRDQNLVKHLDACETMGCATTICTDKTGTLTANKMTVRAIHVGKKNYVVADPSMSLGSYVLHHEGGACETIVDIVCKSIAINTMNESVLYYTKEGNEIEGAQGNPTEVALLHLTHDLGANYQSIRNRTKGRSDQGHLGEYLAEGRQFGFSSARKMMSWAIPLEEGGFRIYCKGAAEVVLARCIKILGADGSPERMSTEDQEELLKTSLSYAGRGMRCIAMAYRDVSSDFGLDMLSEEIKNADGTAAYLAETELTFIALLGIEDPLRAEVPGAIEKCYQAGIDVRLVTGDSPNTAVSIAYQAGILRDFHFVDAKDERVATNLRKNVLMEGKAFRDKVYRVDEEGNKEFDQVAFDKIWPRLRVLARSSPDDKLTLAHGLNQSNLFADKEFCKKILESDGIKIFPDRQVVAMTGDGTNDAPALKRADVGFAMGVTGTQIAKDAADIILLDDNFASIVTAAKWGRNVYASIQKFLQFQLTVNISAVTTALVGAFAYQLSPLAAIQLLWVNLLMDSLASLALASEPPVPELLQKPPVNRTDSMITKHMYANMLGQAIYQIIVVMTLLFAGPSIFGFPAGHTIDENSEHYTLIFNSFVWMQLFNEINCRKLKGETNVFKGILDNPLFYGILLTTSVLQVLIVQFGSYAFAVSVGGLSWKYWGVSLAFGIGSFPVQQVINFLYRLCQKYKSYRLTKRRTRAAHEITQPLVAPKS